MATTATRRKPAASAPALRRSRVSRHLVLVNQAGWQDPADLYQIAAKVRWLDPTVGTFIAPSEIDDGVTRDAAATLPSLVVSFGPLGKFQPARGKVYHGGPVNKFEQLRRLAAAGVPVPRTTLLGPQTTLDLKVWGELVIVKPTDLRSSSGGSGIQLRRTADVRYIAPEDYPEGHPGRLGPMLVQQFIDTGERFSLFRVLTLFGRPLYCNITVSHNSRPQLSADDATLATAQIATNALPNDERDKILVFDADAFAIAEAAYRAIPEAPLQGCDIIRDVRTGRSYVLEVNPGGNTWAFSSAFVAEMRRMDGPAFDKARLAQLDAFSSAAHVLLQKVRVEAE
jgi:hypothetical protein